MKRTLKRELKVLEIAKREAVGPSTARVAAGGAHAPPPPARASQHQFGPREVTSGEVPQPCSRGCLRLKPGGRAAGRTEAQVLAHDADEMGPTDPS